MHLLVIPSWYPSPENPIAGIFFRDAARAIRPHLARVGVLYSNSRSLRRGIRFPHITRTDDGGLATYGRATINWLPKIPHGHSALYRRNGLRLFERYLAEQGRPDLIHAHACLYGGFLARELGMRYGIPYVITEHSSDYARGVLPAWKLAVARRVLRDAAAVVTVSPWLGEVLATAVGLSAHGWHWIPNLVGDDFFEQPLEEIPARPLRFIAVGVLDEKKGHRDLLEAFALRFRDAQSELVVIGTGRCDRALRAQAQALGIAARVRFLGVCPRDRVRLEIARSHALVLPSHQETFGVVLIEALALGVPVIATCSGGPECIVTPENGRLVDPRAPGQLAAAMEALAGDLLRYDRGALRRDCRARFGSAAVAAQTVELYRQVRS